MSEQTREFTERRSERRLAIDARITGYVDWQKTLHHRMEAREITLDKMFEMVSRSMVARDLVAQRLKEETSIDYLTGLYNKRAFDVKFEEMFLNETDFGFLIVDIDHFKEVNDTHGHYSGDKVIVGTSLMLSSFLHQTRLPDTNDIVGRIGGEEFGVLVRDVKTKEDLQKVADNLRLAIASSPFTVTKLKSEAQIPVTVSIGGYLRKDSVDKTSLFNSADHALYDAKNSGRNKAIIHG